MDMGSLQYLHLPPNHR